MGAARSTHYQTLDSLATRFTRADKIQNNETLLVVAQISSQKDRFGLEIIFDNLYHRYTDTKGLSTQEAKSTIQRICSVADKYNTIKSRKITGNQLYKDTTATDALNQYYTHDNN